MTTTRKRKPKLRSQRAQEIRERKFWARHGIVKSDAEISAAAAIHRLPPHRRQPAEQRRELSRPQARRQESAPRLRTVIYDGEPVLWFNEQPACQQHRHKRQSGASK
jgi:hypothetical protein